jgi:hypothetical protein
VNIEIIEMAEGRFEPGTFGPSVPLTADFSTWYCGQGVPGV